MLKVQVLGRPAANNALRVTADSGQGPARGRRGCSSTAARLR